MSSSGEWFQFSVIGTEVGGPKVYDENSLGPYCKEPSILFSEIWINPFNAMGKHAFYLFFMDVG